MTTDLDQSNYGLALDRGTDGPTVGAIDKPNRLQRTITTGIASTVQPWDALILFKISPGNPYSLTLLPVSDWLKNAYGQIPLTIKFLNNNGGNVLTIFAAGSDSIDGSAFVQIVPSTSPFTTLVLMPRADLVGWLILGYGSTTVNNPSFLSVTDFGAVCDGSTDDTIAWQAAITQAKANGGGTISMPAAASVITDTLTIDHSGIVLQGVGAPSTGQAPTTEWTSRLYWFGAGGKPMVKFTSVAGQAIISGCGVRSIGFTGFTTQDIAIQIRGLINSRFEQLAVYGDFNQMAIDIGTLPTVSQDTGTQFNIFDQVQIFQLGSGHGIVCDMDNAGSGNTSENNFHNIVVVHVNGNGVVLKGADHNVFDGGIFFGIGTGKGIDFSGNISTGYTSNSNVFRNINPNTGVIVRGTELLASPCTRNLITQLGTGDQLQVTLGTNASLDYDYIGYQGPGGSCSLTLLNGANHNITTPKGSSVVITGPTGAFSIGGFTLALDAGPDTFADGVILRLYNPTGQTMTFLNENASSTAAYRIRTPTGADFAVTHTHAVLRYIAFGINRWIVESSN